MKYFYTLSLVVLSTIMYQHSFGQHVQNMFDSKKKTLEKPKDFTLNPLKASNAVSQDQRRKVEATYKTIHGFPSKAQNRDIKINKIVRSEKTGRPIFIECFDDKLHIDDLSATEMIKDKCFDFLLDISYLIGEIHPNNDLEIEDINYDSKGHIHIRISQQYKGIPVYGAELMVHFKQNGVVVYNGGYYPIHNSFDITANFQKEEAINNVKEDVANMKDYAELNNAQKKLLKYNGPEAALVILPDWYGKKPHILAWEIKIRSNFIHYWKYFVDAKTGKITMKYDISCSIGPDVANATDLNGVLQTINVYDLSGTFYLIDASRSMYSASQSTLPDDPVGAIWTLNANNSDLNSVSQFSSGTNSWSDQSSVSAHNNAALSYEYYKTTHNRESLDGNGGTIISVVNVTNNGQPMDNAFWNGQLMAYGNGNTGFKPLAGGLDVAAHEMTHGVISKTANLEYLFQSGAINESMADIFGAMVDRDDWRLGEDVVLGSVFPSGALRDLQNPHNGGTDGDFYWQPENMSEYKDLTQSQDNGGVHINSGIPNKAYYAFATAVTKDVAEDVYYHALTNYLTRSSQFIDLRLAVIQSATDLYNATVISSAKSAFDGVGITDDTGGSYENDIPPVDGLDYILSYDVDSTNPNTFYISETDGTGFNAMSTTKAIRKPSVTDNGEKAIFVNSSNNIVSIKLTPGTADEQVLTTDGFWDNAAISKDGSKIAGISIYIDTTIYVYDYNLAQWHEFKLYNPTYSEGVETGGARFADAIEWDYSGEYLIYDAYNEIDNPGGTNIDYWDVGFIKVWDRTSNTWGDGEITKLYSSLPEDVNIGNPILAKNSPYIIAYDYFDEFRGGVYIYGANMETGETDSIFTNVMLGNPDYSKMDDKMIFTTLDTNNDTIIAEIDLDVNKISPAGTATALIDVGKWARWYTKGIRPFTKELKNEIIGMKLYPNPVTHHLTVQFHHLFKGKQINIYDVLGREVKDAVLTSMNGNSNKIAIDVADLPSGAYFLKSRSDLSNVSVKFIKMN